jgi:hypothetical protein
VAFKYSAQINNDTNIIMMCGDMNNTDDGRISSDFLMQFRWLYDASEGDYD